MAIAPSRPGALTTAAVLCIVYGCMQGFGVISSMVMKAIGGGNVLGQGGADMDAFFRQEIPSYDLIFWGNALSETVEVVAILFAGFGLLNLKQWGRALAIPALIWAIVRSIAYAVIFLAMISPALTQFVEKQVPVKKGPEQDIMKIAMGCIGACSGIMIFAWVCYLGAILILLFRPSVKQALASGGMPTEDTLKDRQSSFDERRPSQEDYDEGWDAPR